MCIFATDSSICVHFLDEIQNKINRKPQVQVYGKFILKRDHVIGGVYIP